MTAERVRAYGDPLGQGLLRTVADDFVVQEEMGFEPDGSGEHCWCLIRKVGWNTEDVAMWLAKHAGIHRLRVGYSGLKDRHAVTDQWFSLHLPGQPDPDFAHMPDGLTLLRCDRHSRKLNRGTHRRNHFIIRVRECTATPARVDQRLQQIRSEGVPNYFGEQRFGRGGRNVTQATAWLSGQGDAPRKKALRSIWLSAVRSDLFNRVLAERVRQGNWHRLVEGDWLQPDSRRGVFPADQDDLAVQRVTRLEVHPVLPLPGLAPLPVSGEAKAIEEQVLAPFESLIEALKTHGLKEERRASRLCPQDLSWCWLTNTSPVSPPVSGLPQLELRFALPKGAFATTVLEELLEGIQAPHRTQHLDG